MDDNWMEQERMREETRRHMKEAALVNALRLDINQFLWKEAIPDNREQLVLRLAEYLLPGKSVTANTK